MSDFHPETREIAAILAEHDPHHGGTVHLSAANDSATPCHAVDEHVSGVPSQQAANAVEAYINNVVGTPADSEKVAAWAKRRGIPKPKARNDNAWTAQVVANEGIAHCDKTPA